MKQNMEKTSLPVPWPLRGQQCQLRIVQRKEDGRKYEFSLGRRTIRPAVSLSEASTTVFGVENKYSVKL
jgi:hypothetical protein